MVGLLSWPARFLIHSHVIPKGHMQGCSLHDPDTQADFFLKNQDIAFIYLFILIEDAVFILIFILCFKMS